MLQRVTPALRVFSMAAAHRALARMRQPAAVVDLSRRRLLAVGGLDCASRPHTASSGVADPFPGELIERLAHAAANGGFAPGGPRLLVHQGRTYRFSPLPAGHDELIALVRLDLRAAPRQPDLAATAPGIGATNATDAIEFARPAAAVMPVEAPARQVAAGSRPEVLNAEVESVTPPDIPSRRPLPKPQVSDADQETLAAIARRIRAGHRGPSVDPVSEDRSANVAERLRPAGSADAHPTGSDRAPDESRPPRRNRTTATERDDDHGAERDNEDNDNRELVHELRTPLAAITTLADMLAEDVVAQDNIARRRLYAQRIADTARHAISVVEAMSEHGSAPITTPISKADPARTARASLVPADTSVAADRAQAATPGGGNLADRATVDDIVDETCSAMRPMAEQNGLDLMIDLAGDATRLTIAARPLRQMIINLVGNAIRHTPGKQTSSAGTVLVATRTAPDGGGIVDILDDGPGFSARTVLQRRGIDGLGRHGRANDGGKAADGHGLGLMIVDRLAREHGVAFELESQPGHGTRATLRLPACPRGAGLPTMARSHD